MLAPNPAAVFALGEAELIQLFKRGEHKAWRENVYVLHQENLNQELYDFLVLKGYPKNVAQMVFTKEKANVSTSSETDHESLWTPELRQLFYDYNWPYFEIFSEYKSELKGISTKL